jgi:hypothetical protein
MVQAFARAVRLTLSPNDEWQAIREEAPDSVAIFRSFVLPLAGVPAVCWMLNQLLFADSEGRVRAGAASVPAQAVQAGLTVFAGALLSVILLAASIYVLAPLFSRPRDWPRALQVASYSNAPVLLGGVFLLLPDLAMVLLLAAFHSAYLVYAGLQTVLEVKEDRAAEYVALGTVILIAASTLLGALGSALGIL